MSFNSVDAEIFRSGPKAWNAWRENNPSEIPDLTGIKLALNERQMGPAQGGPINLKSVCFRDSFLRFATLTGAQLENADMGAADLVHARFQFANLTGSNLRGAQLDHADFGGAVLKKAELSDAILPFANFIAADLEGADLVSADCKSARFDRSNLRGANLSNASLDHADFAGADLLRANLCGAKLYYAKNLTEEQLKGTLTNQSTVLPAQFQGSLLSEPPRRAGSDLGNCEIEAAATVVHGNKNRAVVWLAAICLIGGALAFSRFSNSLVTTGEKSVEYARPENPADGYSNRPQINSTPSLGPSADPQPAPSGGIPAVHETRPTAASGQEASPSKFEAGNTTEQEAVLSTATPEATLSPTPSPGIETVLAPAAEQEVPRDAALPDAEPSQSANTEIETSTETASENRAPQMAGPAESDTHPHDASASGPNAVAVNQSPADLPKGSESNAIASTSVDNELLALSPAPRAGHPGLIKQDEPPLPIRKPRLSASREKPSEQSVSVRKPANKRYDGKIASGKRAPPVTKAPGEKFETSQRVPSPASDILAGGL